MVKTATPLPFSGFDTVVEGAEYNVTDPVGVPADDVTVTVTLTLP